MPTKVAANTYAKEIRIHSTLIERPPGASDSFSMPLGKLQHVKCHSNPPLIQVV